jgi:hypothetical protein
MARTYVNGKVHVRRTMCSTCIFRPEGRGRIAVGDERIAEMIAGAVAAESCIPCHAHLYEGQAVEPVCRGFYDRHATAPIQIAERLGFLEWVD